MPLLSTVASASHRGFRSYGTSFAGPITAFGGTEYIDPTDADYKIHEFISDGIFEVTQCPDSATVEVMAVGGGGSSGAGDYGGGGAGGYVWKPNFQIGTGSWNVVIGLGGLGTFSARPAATDTVFGSPDGSSSIRALAGGSTAIGAFIDGGSGGGAVLRANNSQAGTGLQPTSASGGYGNRGGLVDNTGSWTGGGGGAGGAGSSEIGGAGRTADIRNQSGLFEVFAAGGYGTRSGTSPILLPVIRLNSGNGAYGGGSGYGQNGIVRIRYQFQ